MNVVEAREFWRKYDDMERRLTRPLTDRMLELGGLIPGMNVLDIGTGRGEPAIAAAQRVEPAGEVLGIDISEDMLQLTRDRASGEGVTNLRLDRQSAETLDAPRKHFDVAVARWSLMYLQSPALALRTITRALKPGALMIAALWTEPERAGYFTLPRKSENCRSIFKRSGKATSREKSGP
jgi:ubiquinone/menaquinone biosynthesis C-methylase UbiE